MTDPSERNAERLFETWCAQSNVRVEPVERGRTPTPDFTIWLHGVAITCEVKQIEPNAADKADLVSEVTEGRIVPNRLRGKLGKVSRQLKDASVGGRPTMLVVYDNTPFRTYCDHPDVIQAMLGDDTVRVDVRSAKVLQKYLGANKRFTPKHNTSVSVLAVLEPSADRDGLRLRLYHNPYARVILEPRLLEGLRTTTRLRVGARSVRLYGVD